MLKIGTIPNSDSQLLCAIALGRIFRRLGHSCTIALDPGHYLYSLMAAVARQEGEEIASISALERERPDIVLFDSNQILRRLFFDFFRIDFIPGAHTHERESIFLIQHFSNGNFVFSPNYIQRDFPGIYHGRIPVLGMPTTELYQPRDSSDQIILYPDSYPMSAECRKQWFQFLEKIAMRYPDHGVVIKERFNPKEFAHFPFHSYKSLFTSKTPANLKLISHKENTRAWINIAEVLIGVQSGIFLEGALIGKKVCLVKDPPAERINGLTLQNDFFQENDLRSSMQEILTDIHSAAKIDRQTLDDYLPLRFDGERFVRFIETIFNIFPDPELRCACKFDVSLSGDFERSLLRLKKRVKDPASEGRKNRIRSQYYMALGQTARLFNLVSPDISNRDLNLFLERNDFFKNLPMDSAKVQKFIARRRESIVDNLVMEFYHADAIDMVFSQKNHTETEFLSLGYDVVASLKRNNREAEARAYEHRLAGAIQRSASAPHHRYKVASTLKRVGRYDDARNGFERLLEDDKIEHHLRFGSFFHLGDICFLAGDNIQAEKYLQSCLKLENNHIQARRLLEKISGRQ